MAYRSSASTSFAGTASLVATAPAGVANNDYLVAVSMQDTSGGTYTPPSGWTERASIALTTAFNQTAKIYDKIAGGSEPGTYTWTSNDTTSAKIVIAAFSGRNTSAPRTFLQTTLNVTNNSSPITLASTGGTCAANDDLAYFVAPGKSTTEDWTLTAPSGFTTRENNNGSWTTLHLATKDAQGAGATGTIAGVDTVTGSGTAGYGSFVVAIAVASGAPAPGYPVARPVF